MDANTIQRTIDLIKETLSGPGSQDLAKAWTQSGSAVSGITAYDLEAPAKLLYPVMTPIRNITPRAKATGGIQANWRGVTGINTTRLPMGRVEGKRSGVMVTTTADFLAVFRALGLEDSVTWEADFSAEGFQDLKALAVMQLLRATMIGEEKILLGGQGTFALARTPTPAATPSNSNGTCTAANSPYSIYCVALNRDGWDRSSVASGVIQDIVRVNADGTSDTVKGGSARVSVVQTATIGSGSTGSIVCTVAAVQGAVAYAWFWGANGADVKLGAITTINTYTIATDVATGTQTYASMDNASDHSQDTTVFDGLLSLAAKTGSNSYYKSLDGAVLTASGAGGIVEIDDALQWFWDNYRISPDCIWVSAQERKNINAKALTGSSTAAQRFVFDVQQGQLKGGVMVRSYLNPFTLSGEAEEIPIRIHPDLPPGTIMFTTQTLPYPLSNVANVWRLLLRYDYRQMEWPMVSPKYSYGVYLDGVLQHYFTPSLGVISNIKNG